MDMGGEDKFESEKKTDNSLHYHSSTIPTDWPYGGANLPNSTIDSIVMSNPLVACKGDLIGASPCSSAPMIDSFCPTPWNNPTNSFNVGFSDMATNASTSNTLGFRRGNPGASRIGMDKALEIGWSPMLKGGLFISNAPGMLPHSLSQFPADSGFIQRAARFSCFSGGNFSDLASPFSAPGSTVPYPRSGVAMQGPEEVLAGNGLKSMSDEQSQKNEVNMVEGSKDVPFSVEHGAPEGSTPKDDRKNESFLRSFDERKQGVGVSGDESDEAEFSGDFGQVDGSGGEPSSGKGFGSKKRKRTTQKNTEPNQVKEASLQSAEGARDDDESQQKGEQNSTLATNRTTGKHGKQGSQASDPPKEEYIHVRARRGQATNSHSLAERVRREKISERMKFLQDLVPGCSKVTGKAVMLDEIINYVQSLQRQVEFLSMKLATVNPQLDFNIEGLLAKDVLQTRPGPPSSLGLTPDMRTSFPQLHPSQPMLLQAGLPVMVNSSDVLRQTMNTQLAAMGVGFKEPSSQSQLPNVWEDELHNVVQMGFGNGSDPTSSQDLNEKTDGSTIQR